MIRNLLLRGAWLMLGAAIGVAAGLLSGTIVGGLAPGASTTAVAGAARPAVVGGIVGALLVAALIGLLPGVREIQVTAARTLLGIARPLVVPEPMRARHRGLTVLWTVFHAGAGLVTGFCVFGLLPGAVLTVVWTATGREDLLTSVGWAAPGWQLVVAGVGMLIGTFAGVVGCGWAAVRLAPILLGPSAADRLALAETRLAEERRHTTLARELHDGIGHALSIISIQAAAARRVAEAQPDRASAALHVIEQTSRGAQGELDHLLGLLRDPDAPAPRRNPEEDLPTLVARHRDAGLAVEVRDTHTSVPQLVWTTALDILAEALTNAHRHGVGSTSGVSTSSTDVGTTEVVIEQVPGSLRLTVTSPLAADQRRRRRRPGRGILGMQERAALLDGTVTAGPVAAKLRSGGPAEWQVVAAIPVPKDPRRRPSEETP